MDNETRLKVFIAAATAQSITRAADILTISQPAVSRHIKLLEQAIGCKLFRRHGRGITLTDDGQRLFDVVSPALNRIDAMIGQLQLSSKSVAGQLRIASVHTLNSYFVTPLLKVALESYPALTLQMLERSSLKVGQLVERGMADIGLAYDSMVSAENLHSIHLHEEQMQLFHCVNDDKELSKKLTKDGQLELTSELEFIAPPTGYALRQMMDRRLGLDTRHIIQVETIALMLDAVRSGLGVCILPKNMPNHLVEDHGLMRKDIAPPHLSRRVVLIARMESVSVPAIKHMIEQCVMASGKLNNN